MRLLGGVIDGGGALRAGGGEHHVDRAADGGHVKENISADERLRLGDDRAARGFYLRAQRAHAFDMLVDGAAADVASAGERHAGAAKARKQRADIIRRCAHAAAQIQRHVRAADGTGVHLHDAFFRVPIHLGAEVTQRLRGNVDVLDVGQVLNHAGCAAQNGGRNDGHGCVLAAADAHGAFKPLPAGDEHSLFLSHACPPLFVQ